MSWARRRKLLISLIIVLAILPVVAYFAYPFFNVAPTCSDREQNGTETGVDCGGMCAYMCKAGLASLSVEFSRALTLLPGVYTAVAYVTNSNPGAYSSDVAYSFDLYDEKNVFITSKTGQTYILPGRTTPIVETNIRTGEVVPTKAFLTIAEYPPMRDMKRLKLTTLTVSEYELRDESSLPHLDARISNPTLSKVSDVEVYAVIFDTNGNVRAASKSKVSSIEGGRSEPVVFTWPSRFTFTVGTIDIIPRVRPI